MRKTQTGIALAIVLWFIAGMSLLVAGIVFNARTDTRLAQIHYARAQAVAAGDGAINLFLADVVDGTVYPTPDALAIMSAYNLGGLNVMVSAVPNSWLVDMGNANVELLSEVLRLSGAAASGDAEGLALAIVQWRDSQGAAGFKAIEDLLSVPGVNRGAWDRLRDFVASPAAGGGLGRLNGQARQRLVGMLRSAETLSQYGEDQVATGLTGDAPLRLRGLRVDAHVKVGDTLWLRRRWVVSAAAGFELPWRAVRTEPPRVVSRGA
jgi:hypothetical protein